MQGLPRPLDQAQGKMTEMSGPSHGERSAGLVIFDTKDPRSVYNLVTDRLRQAIDFVHPHIWDYSLKGIERHAKPTPTLAKLRVSFWHEYNETQDKGRVRLNLDRVYHGICSRSKFYSFFEDQFKIAYLLYPTTDYIASMLEIHDLALREMREILAMPSKSPAIMAKKIKIFELIDARVKGAVPLRVQHDNRHVHVHQNVAAQHQEGQQSIDELETEIKQLETQIDKPLVNEFIPQPIVDIKDKNGG